MAEERKRIPGKTVRRSNHIVIIFIIAALVIVGKLFYLQIIKYDEYHSLVRRTITSQTVVNPLRGTIYDTNGNMLATNETVYLCFIDPNAIITRMEKIEEAEEQAKKNKDKDKDKDKEKKKDNEDGDEEEEEVVDRTEWTSPDGKSHKGLKENQLVAYVLSDILEVDYDFVLDKAALKNRKYEVIAEQISGEKEDILTEAIEKYGLETEIYLKAEPLRYYPGGDLACHTVGFTNTDGVGIYGLEAYYNNLLEGTSGRYITAHDARGRRMDFDYETYIDPENGYNITTTLDSYIQYTLENEIEATLKENMAANRVTGIAMNVKTGAILGMATAPTFNCNEPYELDEQSKAKLTAFPGSEEEAQIMNELSANRLKEMNEEYKEEPAAYSKMSEKLRTEAEAYAKSHRNELVDKAYDEYYFRLLYEMWKNKAVTELYEPGSTSKIITTAMVFQEKKVSPSDLFTCNGSLMVEGYPRAIHCHNHAGHGTVTYARGLQQSCNPTLMQAAARIGRETFYKYFLDFGYGDVTGIDVPNEARSYYHSYSDFSNVSLAVYSFGQTYKTTAIQQLTAIAAVANGGNLVTPHLLKEVTDDDGNIIKSYGTDIKRQVISPEVSQTIADILQEGVATDGGAKNAYVKGYTVAAKTGTSEKIDEKDPTGETFLRVGSCVAFAPADDPEIAVIIVCDEPMGGSVYGSVVAAPYVSDFLANVLPYLGYEPQYTEEELNNLEISIRDYTGFDVSGAKSDVTNKGMRAVVVGSGETITGQVPAAGTTMSKENGKIILYTGGEAPKDTVEVPDVSGKNAEQANLILTNAGLNICISGTTSNSEAVVMSQSVPAGTIVPEGTAVEVSVRVMSNAADD